GDVDIAQEQVRRLHRDDPGERELLDQTVLQRMEDALRPTPRLRRIGRDMLDAQMLQRPAHLRRARAVDLAARLRRVKIMAAPIRIKAQRQTMLAKHLRQAPECRGRAFFGRQKRRQNGARRIVHRDNQIQRRLARKPRMRRGVLMQHHARQGPALPLAPMRPATFGLLQQALRMQKPLRPRIAPAEQVILHQMLVEMLGREARVARAIQGLDLVAAIPRNPLARRLAKPTVQQSGLAFALEAQTPATERPLPHTQQLRSLQLAQFRRFVTAQNARKLDHPHTLMGFRPAHPNPPSREKCYRTDRALPKPDISCATDTQPALDLVVTMDDATSAILSAFLAPEEGTASTFRGLA